MSHYTIFISDLHLSNTTFDTTKLFLKFLDKISNEITNEIDALYILGDLFRFWVGDDDHSPFNEQIKVVLKEASNKIPIYLMPGNRDFLLGEAFARESGCVLIHDPYVINLYGKKTVLTHGDILCTKDSKYRLFRKIIRIPSGVKIFLKLPLFIRLWFANNIQNYSAKLKLAKSKEILAAQPEDVKKLINKFNSDQVIHGHTHIAEVAELLNGKEKIRCISLGEWGEQGSIFVYNDSHGFEFRTFT